MSPWGVIGQKEEHYKAARAAAPDTVEISRIAGYCKGCNHIEMYPGDDFEEHNGGLMIDRKKVTIVRADGSEVKKLRRGAGQKFNIYYHCNHCVNQW